MSTTKEAILEVLDQLREDQLKMVMDYAMSLASGDERDLWRRFGQFQLARAYGDDDPNYTEADLKSGS